MGIIYSELQYLSKCTKTLKAAINLLNIAKK